MSQSLYTLRKHVYSLVSMHSKGKGYTRTLTVSNAFYSMMRLACYDVIVMSQGVILKIYKVCFTVLSVPFHVTEYSVWFLENFLQGQL